MDQVQQRDKIPRTQAIALLMVLLWSVYCLNGFRPPTQAIELSDEDAGSTLRQVLFGGSAFVSGVLIWMNRALWTSIKVHWAWILFGLWGVLSVLYSQQTGITLKRSVLLCCGLTTAIFAVSTINDNPLTRTVWVIASICAFASLMSLLWLILFPPSITTNPGRPGLAGISNHPNTLAPACAIGCSFFCVVHAESRLLVLWKWVGFVSCLVALLLTGSVTSIFLGLVGMSIAMIILNGGYLGVIGGILFLAIIFAVMINGPSTITAIMFESVDRDPSMSGRDQLWAIVWEQIQIHPLFGHGWGAYWTEGKGRELVGNWNPRQSHNAYLDIILEIGFVGFLFLLIPILQAYKSAVKLRSQFVHNDTRRAAAGCIGVMISLLFVYGFQQSFLGKPDSFTFVVFLCITLAIRNESRRIGAEII